MAFMWGNWAHQNQRFHLRPVDATNATATSWSVAVHDLDGARDRPVRDLGGAQGGGAMDKPACVRVRLGRPSAFGVTGFSIDALFGPSGVTVVKSCPFLKWLGESVVSAASDVGSMTMLRGRTVHVCWSG